MSSADNLKRPEGVDGSFRRLGKHYVRVDGDIIWIHQVGHLELDEVIQVFQLGYEVGDRYGYMLFLGDARHALPATAEARRYQLEQIKVRNLPSHTAIYGANLVVRTVVTLTQRAVELMTGKPPPMTFVKDEAAARKCLEAARINLRLRVKSAGHHPSPP
jgi:hypothetical protein